MVNYFGPNFFTKQSVAILKGYCEKEDFITGTYQTPAGFEDDPSYILSPGHLTERAFRGYNMLTNNNSTTTDFSVDYTGFMARRGFTTPRQILNDVAHYWLCDRATNAQMATLHGIFGGASALDTTVDWNTNDARFKLRDLFRTLQLIDLSHYAA